jgi:hypothetical protein
MKYQQPPQYTANRNVEKEMVIKNLLQLAAPKRRRCGF